MRAIVSCSTATPAALRGWRLARAASRPRRTAALVQLGRSAGAGPDVRGPSTGGVCRRRQRRASGERSNKERQAERDEQPPREPAPRKRRGPSRRGTRGSPAHAHVSRSLSGADQGGPGRRVPPHDAPLEARRWSVPRRRRATGTTSSSPSSLGSCSGARSSLPRRAQNTTHFPAIAGPTRASVGSEAELDEQVLRPSTFSRVREPSSCGPFLWQPACARTCPG